jgi:parvulin-like peptidyl-prolyl isomerase
MRSFGYAQDDNVGARHKKVDTLIKKVDALIKKVDALIKKVDALSKKSARDYKKSVRRTNVTVMTIERSDEESQSVTDLSQKKPLASPRRIS